LLLLLLPPPWAAWPVETTWLLLSACWWGVGVGVGVWGSASQPLGRPNQSFDRTVWGLLDRLIDQSIDDSIDGSTEFSQRV
jgi:hypothetical protein